MSFQSSLKEKSFPQVLIGSTFCIGNWTHMELSVGNSMFVFGVEVIHGRPSVLPVNGVLKGVQVMRSSFH